MTEKDKTECQCASHGFCELRQCNVIKGLWKECQAGKFAMVTRMTEELSLPRESKMVIYPRRKKSILRVVIDFVKRLVIKKPRGCGGCRSKES
jgi:hypothetical protein